MRDIALIVAMILAAWAFIGANQARNDANKAQRNLCAWQFYEDGSASVRTNDFSRFHCMDVAAK